MGYYINPPDMSKEDFLKKHGTPHAQESLADFDYSGEELPVCLIDNGWMTAAGIAYAPQEYKAFAHPCGRPKQWFTVKKSELEPYYKEK